MAGQPRVVLVEDGSHDVFEVLSIDGNVIRARTPFLFEIGEELAVRVEDGGTREVTVRVRAHTGEPRVTELEIAP